MVSINQASLTKLMTLVYVMMDALRHLQKVLPGLTVLVFLSSSSSCAVLDELCQSEVETHISFAWQQ